MKSNDEILHSLDTCQRAGWDCGGCAYRNEDFCQTRMKRDAAALIRELTEPRVLKIGEISSMICPVWLEMRDDDYEWAGWVMYDREHQPDLVFQAMGRREELHAPVDAYGVTWRCWTLAAPYGERWVQ